MFQHDSNGAALVRGMVEEADPGPVVPVPRHAAEPVEAIWLYSDTAGQIQLFDEDGAIRAYTWYVERQKTWRAQVIGRRDPEPPALTLNQMQHHLEEQTGIVPAQR